MIQTWFKNGKLFLGSKQGSILSAAVVMMMATLASALLGFIRERMLNASFTQDELGVYTAAFRLPDLLFDISVMGILFTAFIPIFTHTVVARSKDIAFAFTSRLINISCLVVGSLVLLLVIFADPISHLIVPGFNPGERALMVFYTRIILIGQVVPLLVGNYFIGILQSFQYFIIPAIAPIVYNLGIICGILFLAPLYGLTGVIGGVVLGSLLFLVIEIPLIYRVGYRHKFYIKPDREVKETFKLMLPRTIGLSLSQIAITADLILSSILGARAVRIFYLAQLLHYQPVRIFGMTFAHAALPLLSTEAARKDMNAFKKLLLASLHQILFFVLPLSVMLAVLRTPLVRIVFGAEKFDWQATVVTGQTLSLFAISIFAECIALLFTRAFYALHDTKTPVLISVVSIIVNIVCSVVFIFYWKLPVWALALSASLAAILSFLLLFVFLSQKIGGFDWRPLLLPPLKMVIASLIAGVFLYIPMKLLDQLIFDTTRFLPLLMLTGVATVSGLSVYVFLAWFLDIEEVMTFFKILQKVKRVPRYFFSRSDDLMHEDRASIS